MHHVYGALSKNDKDHILAAEGYRIERRIPFTEYDRNQDQRYYSIAGSKQLGLVVYVLHGTTGKKIFDVAVLVPAHGSCASNVALGSTWSLLEEYSFRHARRASTM